MARTAQASNRTIASFIAQTRAETSVTTAKIASAMGG